jgi:hypothetical protein
MDAEFVPPIRSHKFSSIDEAKVFEREEQPESLFGNSFIGSSETFCALY